MSGDRPSWDQTWMSVAEVVALRSPCWRCRVGAVIVDAENRIRATGYNGPPAGFPRSSDDCRDWCPRASAGDGAGADHDDCVASHAEANALMFGDRAERVGGTLYVTRPSCLTCAKMVANSGLHRVMWRIAPSDRHLLPMRTRAALRQCGLAVDERR